MRKIGFTSKLAAYAASMVFSIGVWGSYNFLTEVPTANIPEIPIINLDSLSPNITTVAHAQTTNPFGMLPKAGAGVANMGMPPGMQAPTPPGVPEMPSGGNVGNVGLQEKLVVTGVLPPDVVILSRGGKTITARSGQDTEFGTIGTVTIKGAYVDGSFVALK